MQEDKKLLKGQLSPEAIEALKKKHGKLFVVEVGDSIAYLRKPTRVEMSAAISLGSSNPIKFNETLLENCMIAGDEEIKTDDDKFFGVCKELEKIIPHTVASLKEV